MLLPTAILLLISLGSLSFAGVRSGKAIADWPTATATYEAGKPVQTGLRLVLDEGFHTYWSNPGEGGMKISVNWDLPAGWTAGELEHPLPERFDAGGLANFGYKGSVVFPVKLTAPAEAAGPVTLLAQVFWLNCDDNTCIPGEAALELTLEPGPPTATAEAKEIDAALAQVPRPNEGALTLSVTEKPDSLRLIIKATDAEWNANKHEIFPATPEIIDPAAEFIFTRQDAVWTAEVSKSKYLETPVTELLLVLAGPDGAPPTSLTWKRK